MISAKEQAFNFLLPCSLRYEQPRTVQAGSVASSPSNRPASYRPRLLSLPCFPALSIVTALPLWAPATLHVLVGLFFSPPKRAGQ